MGLVDEAQRRLGLEGLAERLASAPSADWTAVQMEVARLRAAQRGPSDVLGRWDDGWVRPAALDQRALRGAEVELLELAHDHEALELSPLAPLGAVTSVAAGSQNRILSASRGLEVLSDPTNVLAIEVAARRRRGERGPIRLCTCARVVRGQPLQDPSHSRHFTMFAGVTGARHKDSRAFAAEVVPAYLELLGRVVHRLRDLDLDLGTPRHQLHVSPDYASVADAIAASHGATVHPLEGAYYAGLRFQLFVPVGGRELQIGDGGLLDWGRKLRSDRTEQLASFAFGIELALRLGQRG
ncbi:MAG: hypothetical protein H6738_10145 [Alphaproteobacteria bacterium]|nr:hypothetical protein [Alphaproteobacteria bacterium]